MDLLCIWLAIKRFSLKPMIVNLKPWISNHQLRIVKYYPRFKVKTKVLNYKPRFKVLLCIWLAIQSVYIFTLQCTCISKRFSECR